MRTPRGPRKDRSIPETNPNVTRSPRPPGLDNPNTGVPMAGASVAHASAGAWPVSTSITARSPSTSWPATVPSAVCPSAKVTVTSLPRTLCALVSTRPSESTTPEPTPHRCPMPTTEAPAPSASRAMLAWISSKTVITLTFH